MERTELLLSFKGERTYIQGGDIFNAVQFHARKMDQAAFVGYLAFRQFARCDCDLTWKTPDSAKHIIAQGHVTFPDAKKQYWIQESKRDAVGRKPFEEHRIVMHAKCDRESIVLTQRSRYSPIEEVIALTKRLNYECLPEIDGKWLFGQLNLSEPLPEAYSELVVTRQKVFSNKFSVNSIRTDGRHIGDIRFIVGKP